MDSQFAVIPAAIGMMLGPQIISSIFLATSKKSRPNSLAYISGVFLASTIGMLLAFYSAQLFGAATDNSDKGQDILTYLIVALLVFLSIKTFLERKTAKTPEWMGTLQEAEPKFAFRLGIQARVDAHPPDADRHHHHVECWRLSGTQRVRVH